MMQFIVDHWSDVQTDIEVHVLPLGWESPRGITNRPAGVTLISPHIWTYWIRLIWEHRTNRNNAISRLMTGADCCYESNQYSTA